MYYICTHLFTIKMVAPTTLLLQSIADSRFAHETFDNLPESNPNIKRSLRLLRLFGTISAGKNIKTSGNINEYFLRNEITVNGTPAIELYRRFGKKPTFSDVSINEFEVKKLPGDNYVITDTDGERYVHMKLDLESEDDMLKLFKLVVKYAPIGCFVELQPDSHVAGEVFVGMVMTYDCKRIPISLVSADIGCGLAMLPVVKEGKHVNIEDIGVENMEEFKIDFLCNVRKSIRRGRTVERGETVNENIHEALSFYGDDDIISWLEDFIVIFKKIGMWPDVIQKYKKGEIKHEELSEEQDACLMFLSRFCQSLGSSGNHFFELAKDDRGYMWNVVHSGSRGLGAIIYGVISSSCKILNDGLDVATEELCDFYRLAYDSLNKFARLNRAMCAIAAMKKMGYAYDGETLSRVSSKSWIFESAGDSCKDLLRGLCHNGIKAFTNRETGKLLYVLNKGSITVSRKLSSSIVALKAGDGCVVYVMNDSSCHWEEVSMKESNVLLESGFEICTSSSEWEGGILFAGHGAGRVQSTTLTENQFEFKDLVQYMKENDVVCNIAPGVLGDHPMGYKDVDEILKTLPLDEAACVSHLKTLVSYKEGLPKGPRMSKRFAGYIEKEWENMDNSTRKWMDLNLLYKFISDRCIQDMWESIIWE